MKEFLPLLVKNNGDYYLLDNIVEIPSFNWGEVRITENCAFTGSWPIAAAKVGARYNIFFTYFFSSKVHVWEIDGEGNRIFGFDISDGEIQELCAYLAMIGHPTARIIQARCVARLVTPEDYSSSDTTSKYFAVERDLIQFWSLADLEVKPLLERFTQLSSAIKEIIDENGFVDALTSVPTGYDLPFDVKYADFSIVSSTLISRSINSRHSLAISRLQTELDACCKSVCTNYFVRIECFDLDESLRQTEIKISLDFDEAPSELGLAVARLSFSEQFSNNSGNTNLFETHAIGRIKEGVRDYLRFFISAFLELKQSFTTIVSFADQGQPGQLAIDVQDLPDIEKYLLPDLYAVECASASYPSIDPALFKQLFFRRKPVLFWRGTTTGSWSGKIEDFPLLPRIRASLISASLKNPAINIKISRVEQIPSGSLANVLAFLQENRLLDDVVNERDFSRFRYYIDLPGNGAAWGTIRKYLQGILLFVPPSGRSLAHYQFLTPMEEFIPVKSDLSDLEEKVLWANANPDLASVIAYRGRAKMISYLANIPEIARITIERAILSNPNADERAG